MRITMGCPVCEQPVALDVEIGPGEPSSWGYPGAYPFVDSLDIHTQECDHVLETEDFDPVAVVETAQLTNMVEAEAVADDYDEPWY